MIRDTLALRPDAGRDSFISIQWDGHTHLVAGLTQGVLRAESGTLAEETFCAWRWADNVLTVSNDRYGFLPLFYTVADNRISIAPSLTTLLTQGASTTIDYTALYLFLHLGFYISDQTAFAEIKVVPPAARFYWSRGVLSVDGRYCWGKEQHLDRLDAIDAMRSLFTQSIARRAPGDRYAVPLSGGRDSRHILLELAAQGHRKPICVTARAYGKGIDADVVVATQLANTLTLEHTVVDPPMPIVAAEALKNAETHYCADEHRWYLSVADYVADRADVVYDGIAGDVLTDILGSGACTAAMSHEFESADLSALAGEILGNLDSMIRSLMSADVYARMDRQVALETLRIELAKHAEAPNPVASFFFWNRTRREVSLIPYALLRSLPVVHTPFLDHDLFDLMTSLPWRCVADNRWHTETILECYPAFARIPFADPFEHAAHSAVLERRFDLCFARELAALAVKDVGRQVRLVNRLPVIAMLTGSSVSSRIAHHYGWGFDRLAYVLQLEGLIGRYVH